MQGKIMELKVQYNKKTISALKKKNSENLEDVRSPENANRINARWTNDEVLLGVECVRKFGKDFQAIAETLGTKTEAHVRTFYLNYRRRYNLDQLVKKFEAEKEALAAASSSSSASTGGINDSTNMSSNKKEDAKKKDAVAASSAVTNDESDNPTSRDSNASKSLKNDDKANESANTTRKDNVIMMEIDLDNEQNDAPPNKKFAISVANQDYPKSSAV